MRLSYGRLHALGPSIHDLNVVAVCGPAADVVRSAAREVVQHVLGGARGDFRLQVLEAPDPSRLRGAARSRSLDGSRGVIWVPETSDRLAPVLVELLSDCGNSIVVGGFTERFAKSVVSKQIAASDRGCLLDCNLARGDRRARLAAFMESVAAKVGDHEADLLCGWAEIEQQPVEAIAAIAALLVGAGGTVDGGALLNLGVTADPGTLSRAIASGRSGNLAELDAAVRGALEDGQSGIALLRQALNAVTYRSGDGRGIREARSSLWDAERRAKQTGFPQELLAVAAVRSLGNRGH